MHEEAMRFCPMGGVGLMAQACECDDCRDLIKGNVMPLSKPELEVMHPLIYNQKIICSSARQMPFWIIGGPQAG